jgi:hypothetical protein
VNGGSASDILFNIASPERKGKKRNGPTSNLARGVQFIGTIYAPASKINVARDAVVEGGLLGRQVTLARDVVFTANLAGHVDVYVPLLTKRALVVAEENFVEPEVEAFALSQNYPNPFNPSTTIRYVLGGSENVHLVVYNVLGQQIRTLVDQAQESGGYNVVWNGEDAFGRQVSSGVYFYKIVAGRHQDTRRMVFAK